MPINRAPDRLAVLEAMVRKERELEEAAMAQNPLAGRTAAELSGPTGIAELGRRYGAPSPYGQGQAFTTPEGVKHIRGPGAAVLEMPATFDNTYSPQDQKKIQALYNDRSKVSTDPELDRDEQSRQSALDEIDAEISRIPKLSPIMRQPTPQQQAESKIVTLNNKQYFFDGKNIEPLVDPKVEQTQNDQWEKTFETMLQKEDAYTTEAAKVPFNVKVQRAKVKADIIHGRISDRSAAMIPQLDELWQTQMNYLKSGGFWGRQKKKTVEREEVVDIREAYVAKAKERYAMTEEEARYDFMLRWQKAQANPDDPFNFLLPKMTDDDESEMARSTASFIQAGSPNLSDLSPTDLLPDKYAQGKFGYIPRGGGIVKTGEGTATITPATTAAPSATVEVKDQKGDVYRLPANELQEALQSGYTLVER